MTGLLDAAEIERIALLRGQDQPDHVFVELPACREVTDGQDHVAGPRDSKPGIVVRGRQAHAHLPVLPVAGTQLIAKNRRAIKQRWAISAGP